MEWPFAAGAALEGAMRGAQTPDRKVWRIRSLGRSRRLRTVQTRPHSAIWYRASSTSALTQCLGTQSGQITSRELRVFRPLLTIFASDTPFVFPSRLLYTILSATHPLLMTMTTSPPKKRDAQDEDSVFIALCYYQRPEGHDLPYNVPSPAAHSSCIEPFRRYLTLPSRRCVLPFVRALGNL